MKKTEKLPLISIIIPFYNNEKYINECLDSVLNQDYPNIEIVAMNDGSTDNTGKILQDYSKKDKRIKYYSAKNSGVSAARNNALSKATGDYICLVDQDDTIDSNYISYFYNLISKNNADIATTYQPFKFNKNIVKNIDETKEEIGIITGDEAAEKMLYYKFVIAPWNKMISMDLIKKYNISFKEDLCGG